MTRVFVLNSIELILHADSFLRFAFSRVYLIAGELFRAESDAERTTRHSRLLRFRPTFVKQPYSLENNEPPLAPRYKSINHSCANFPKKRPRFRSNFPRLPFENGFSPVERTDDRREADSRADELPFSP